MILITIILLVAACFESGYSAGESYAVTFMNITSDGIDNSGFTQVFVYSINNVKARILATNYSQDPFIEAGANMKLRFNSTEDFINNRITIATQETEVDNLGMSIYSGAEVSIIGVKSDRGSTDAFLTLRAVRSSKEFIVALWPNKAVFQGSIQILGILNGTCVEVYKVYGGNKFIPVYSASIQEMEVLRFFQRFKINETGQVTKQLEDLTGYYVNASRPIRVIVGHECGNVPENVGYCDHMAEQIPELSQLGRRYVVPPIAGRLLNAGYVIRVVAAQKDVSTAVKVESYTQKLLQFGEYVEVDVLNNMEAVLITCDTNCLVMQYNKGFAAINQQTDTPTDPFMMVITPSDRFTRTASFATPSYCDDLLQRTNFDNYMTVVTYSSYKESIFYDDQQLTKLIPPSSWKQVEEFSVVSLKISHDFHDISSSKGSFAVYVYGHSTMRESPSGYGFAANYNITGEAVDNGWKQSQKLLSNYLLANPSQFCSTNSTISGAIISDVNHASFPFQLQLDIGSIDLTQNCISRLQTQLEEISKNVSQKINEWICLQLNCSYLTSFGVAVSNFSFSFDKDSQGKFTSIAIEVGMIGTYDTLARDFATCRLEIKEYLSYYPNWLSINQLLSGSSNNGCPSSITFASSRINTTETLCRGQ